MSRFRKNYSEKTAALRITFNLLKNDLRSESVLGFYDPNKSVELITDASDFAIGGILLQADKNNFKRPTRVFFYKNKVYKNSSLRES